MSDPMSKNLIGQISCQKFYNFLTLWRSCVKTHHYIYYYRTWAKEFGPRQEELKNIENEGQKLAQQIQSGTLAGEQLTNAQRQIAQLQSDFNLKARALQEDQRKRAQEMEGRVNNEIQKAIDAVAKEQKLDFVMDGMAILNLSNEALNVTDEVLENLKKSYKEGSIANGEKKAK